MINTLFSGLAGFVFYSWTSEICGAIPLKIKTFSIFAMPSEGGGHIDESVWLLSLRGNLVNFQKYEERSSTIIPLYHCMLSSDNYIYGCGVLCRFYPYLGFTRTSLQMNPATPHFLFIRPVRRSPGQGKFRWTTLWKSTDYYRCWRWRRLSLRSPAANSRTG